MNTLFKGKTLLLLIFLMMVILLIIFIQVFLNSQPKPKQKQSPEPVIQFQAPIQAPIKVIGIKPDKTISLQPGTMQQFVIQFSQPVNLDSIHLVVERTDITKDLPPYQAEQDTTLSSDRRSLTILLKKPVLPYSKYDLILTDTKKNAIFQASYLSGKETPMVVKINNFNLSTYLPYETTSFKLSYDKSRNIYVFNFKYDTESPDDLQNQYEKAKSEAVKFIESKEIDINTIVIEWRHS